MSSKMSLVAAYLNRHAGEMLTTEQIGDSTGVRYNTVSSSINTLIERGAPIKRFAKGVWMLTIREQIEDTLRKADAPLSTKEIATATGLTKHQVVGNAGHLARRENSPVVRTGESTFGYEEIQPSSAGTATERKDSATLYERVGNLDSRYFLIRDERGRIYRAEKEQLKMQTVKGIVVNGQLHIIK